MKVEPLNISNETIYELEDNLLLFFTGYSRQAVKILKDQDTKTKLSDKEMIKNLDFIKDLGIQSKDFLEKGDLKSFGELMHEHWLYKKNRTQNISNFKINELYNLGYKNGALGGKLVGAGGGGFLMFYAKDKFKLRTVMKNAGLEEVRFKFDYDGTKTVLRS